MTGTAGEPAGLGLPVIALGRGRGLTMALAAISNILGIGHLVEEDAFKVITLLGEFIAHVYLVDQVGEVRNCPIIDKISAGRSSFSSKVPAGVNRRFRFTHAPLVGMANHAHSRVLTAAAVEGGLSVAFKAVCGLNYLAFGAYRSAGGKPGLDDVQRVF